MEDFAQGIVFIYITTASIGTSCQLCTTVYKAANELQILTCCSQTWLKSSYSHSGFLMLWKFLTKYNFGNCLNIKEIKFTMASHSC
jgi:hypothetical protein